MRPHLLPDPSRLALLGALGVALATPVEAAEGMWLPSQAPDIAAELRQAGLKLDPAALADLARAPMNAIASLGGCSAAFLSPQGLVATNHHCVYGSVQYNSKPDRDYLKDGFLARAPADEVPAAPGTRVYVIEALTDVTRDMLSGLSDRMAGLLRYERLEDNRKRLIARCEQQPSRRCDVRAYFGGSRYYLQQQLEVQDVRLVYAPAGGLGNFGGEIDNWQWPRHTADFGFYRAYVAPDGRSRPFDPANVPFRPKAWLKIAQDGVKDGDFVMVAGFPGTTERLRTAEEARFYYEHYYPEQQRLLAEYSDQIARATGGDKDATIKYASILRGADNYKKKLLGQMAGADAIGLVAKKRAAEAAYRDWIGSGSAQAAYRPAATALDTVVQQTNEAALEDLYANVLNRAQLLSAARLLHRWALEQQKPDAEREPGFQARDRQLLTERLTQIERRFVPAIDRKLFEGALVDYRRLPAAKRNQALDRTLSEVGLDRLYAGTRLGDTPTRLAWLDRPLSDFERSDDPFIRLAVAMSPEDLKAEAAKKDLEGRLQQARSDYLRGMLAFAAAEKRTLYPDANGSLRFTYGRISGRDRDGMRWMPFTTAEGLLAKASGKEPFDAPEAALRRIRAKDYGRHASPALGTLPVNYLSTVDITNGNSGSATLNARGEFVGLAFDGTLDGVISDWWFDPALNRTIHVDSRFMLWTMDKVDGASRLLSEMGVIRQAAAD